MKELSGLQAELDVPNVVETRNPAVRRLRIYAEQMLVGRIKPADEIEHLPHCRQIHIRPRLVWFGLYGQPNYVAVLFLGVLPDLVESLKQALEYVSAIFRKNEIETLATVPEDDRACPKSSGAIDRFFSVFDG